MTSAWWSYVQRVARNETNAAIALRIGVTPSAVGKWQGSAPRIDSAAAFARAYGRPVLEAFVAAGYLTPEQAGQHIEQAPVDPTTLTDDELLAEIQRRMEQPASPA